MDRGFAELMAREYHYETSRCSRDDCPGVEEGECCYAEHIDVDALHRAFSW